MTDVTWFSDAPAPVLSIEMDYFRVPQMEWERSLLRLRQMGANTISTYVMWGWHELRTGQFDFTGESHPGRDLVGFIRLVQELGFWLILKPGPFIDADTLGGGIPSWLLSQSQEAHAQRADGQIWRHSSSQQPRLSALHPKALEHTRRWFAAFSQACSSFQWPQGAIIALQIDNETPGDGLVDFSADGHFYRGDYNPYYTSKLWPEWLEKRHKDLANLREAYGNLASRFAEVVFPANWSEPRTLGDLRLWMDAARFTDWCSIQTVRTYREILNAYGWQTPMLHNLMCAAWEAGGLLVNIGGMAAASGWIGPNYCAKAGREPVLDELGFPMGFGEYVQYIYWRSKLAKSLSPDLPGFASQVSSSSDFFVQSLFAGDTQGANIYPGVQSNPEPSEVGAFLRWAMEAPLQVDGSFRQNAANIQALYYYLLAGGKEFALSKAPSDVLLGYTHVPELAWQWFYQAGSPSGTENRSLLEKLKPELAAALRGSDSSRRSQSIAQELIKRQIDFSIIELDFAGHEQLDPAKLLILPASAILARQTQERLAAFIQQGGKIAWVGGELPEFDEVLLPCDTFRRAAQAPNQVWQLEKLPNDFQEGLVQMGYLPRYTWADDPAGIDVSLRYGPQETIFLCVSNRTQQAYEGVIHYLDPKRSMQKIKAHIARASVSFASLRLGNLESVLLHAAADGAYFQSGSDQIRINYGQVVLAGISQSAVVYSDAPTRIQVNRAGGWNGLSAWQAAGSGKVQPVEVFQSGDQLFLEYPAKGGGSESLFWIIQQSGSRLPDEYYPVFRTLLLTWQRIIRKAALLSQRLESRLIGGKYGLSQPLLSASGESVRRLEEAARDLQTGLDASTSIESYQYQIEQTILTIRPVVQSLMNATRQVRAARVSGDSAAAADWMEDELVLILETLEKLGVHLEHGN